jgi:hypothetical protein
MLLSTKSIFTLYFGATNDAAIALQTYTARGAGFSSTEGVKLQREHRVKNAPSPGAAN